MENLKLDICILGGKNFKQMCRVASVRIDIISTNKKFSSGITFHDP